MPVIEKHVVVNAPVERTFAVLQQVESFSEFLPHVKQVQIVEQQLPRMVLDWVVVAPGVGVEVRWRSHQIVYPDEQRITFRPDGDALVQLSGEWRVQAVDAGCILSTTIEYEAKVPPIFAAVAQKAVNDIIEGWLNGFKQRAEAANGEG
jgi:ribosome-associated toxin RatA of RatAB toxin-antitoxin module